MCTVCICGGFTLFDCVSACMHAHNKCMTQGGVVSNEMPKPFPADVAVVGRDNTWPPVLRDEWSDTRGRMVTPARGKNMKTYTHLFSLRMKAWDGLGLQYIKVMMHDDVTEEGKCDERGGSDDPFPPQSLLLSTTGNHMHYCAFYQNKSILCSFVESETNGVAWSISSIAVAVAVDWIMWWCPHIWFLRTPFR